MTCLEHYFENLIHHGQDIKDECNKNALTPEMREAVELCAQYVKYTLLPCLREDLENLKQEYIYKNDILNIINKYIEIP